MSELAGGKKTMPGGNIVQESHKMQMVPLNRAYSDLFLFWEEEKDPPLSVAEMCGLELNPHFWVPLKSGSCSRPWKAAQLSGANQTSSAPKALQTSAMFWPLFVLGASCTSSCFSPLVRLCEVGPWVSRAYSFFLTFPSSLCYVCGLS